MPATTDYKTAVKTDKDVEYTVKHQLKCNQQCATRALPHYGSANTQLLWV